MIALSLIPCLFAAAAPGQPANFLFAGSDDLPAIRGLISRPDIDGVQIVYTWKSLEPAFGRYDFSQIETDLAVLGPLHKKLFVQVQDRFFRPQDRNVPRYLLEDPVYTGGLVPQSDNPGEGQPAGSGWAAEQWNPHVRHRFQLLLAALAEKFDGRIYGVNLPETAVDLDRKHDRTHFACDAYFAAELENAKFARAVFRKSHVVQYINFWPCEWENSRRYMSRAFAFAAANGIGLGGPDIVPNQRGQMKNSYPFFHEYKGRLALVAMAVQEPTLTYTNPATGKKFTKDEFIDFARDYLGADVVFWSIASPWLHATEPRR